MAAWLNTRPMVTSVVFLFPRLAFLAKISWSNPPSLWNLFERCWECFLFYITPAVSFQERVSTPKRFTATMTTNLGPLLSTFTPSAACASNTGLTAFEQGTATYWAEGPMSTGSQECYPSSYSPDLFHYYSLDSALVDTRLPARASIQSGR